MPKDQKRKHEGYYFVVVDGVPQHCQWQELKDYLRQSAKVRPGHTNVIKVNEDGTRVGFCPVASKFEANKAFDFLVAEGWRGLDIRVSVVWKSDLVSQEIQRRRGPEASRRRRMPTTTLVSSYFRAINGASSNHGYRPYDLDTLSSMPPPDISSEDLTYSNLLHNVSRPLVASSPQFYSMSTCPSPYADGCGSWVYHHEPRTSLGAMSKRPLCRQEEQAGSRNRRTIHLSRLPADTTRYEVQDLLTRYGSVSHVRLWQKRTKYREATALYSRPTEAALAIRELDGCWLQKCQIAVRLDDRDESEAESESSSSDSSGRSSRPRPEAAVTKSGREPLIVNGALRGRSSGSKGSSSRSGRSDRRRGLRDEDSGSSVGGLPETRPLYHDLPKGSGGRHLSPGRRSLGRG